MPPHIVRYPPIQCNTRERCDQLQIPAAPPAWRAPEGPDNLPAAPMGGGRAWPGFEATHNRASAAGVEGAGGSGGHGRASRSTTPSRRLACGDLAGSRTRRCPEHYRCHKQQNSKARVRRARLRCPWAAAGPGRASRRRAERSSQRGRLAGGPPPTGAPSSPATRPGPTAPRTSAVPQATKQQGQGVGGPGCGARGRRRGLAGLRDDAPSKARSADGSRAGRRPRAHQAARPSKAHHAGGRTRRRPEHQRRHNQREPDTRKPRPADAGRGQPTQSGGKV